MNQYESTELAKQMISFLDCSCQVFAPMEDDAPIWEAYIKAREDGKKQGYTPMIVNVDEVLWECLVMNSDEDNEGDYHIENVRDYRKSLLKKTNVEKGLDFLQEELDLRKEECEEDGLDWEEVLGEIKESESIDTFLSYWPYNSNRTNEVILAKIPTENPWEVFAWLPFGDWNDCPGAEDMMAVAKSWYERFGAVPAAVSHDELEFYVEHAVADVENAKKLALEQYAFCADRVDQCEADGSVGKLADSLMKSSMWYFWWD